MITKEELDLLVEKYETEDFIKDDPIQFIHRGKCKEESELSGFIASLFAYGNRKMFIKKLEELFHRADNDILGYINNGDFSNLKGFEYRFAKDFDIIPIFEILHELYGESKGLEELFEYAWETSIGKNSPHPSLSVNSVDISPTKGLLRERIKFKNILYPPPIKGGDCSHSSFHNSENQSYSNFLQTVVDYFYSRAPKTVGHGFYHMIPNPQNGGAMKRMNMFLRWMVRKPPVDLGIWTFMEPKDLVIPLDVHVARVSRNMGLLTRKSNDFKAVMELMEELRKFCPEDPVKYDFAMFAFGVELNKMKMGV